MNIRDSIRLTVCAGGVVFIVAACAFPQCVLIPVWRVGNAACEYMQRKPFDGNLWKNPPAKDTAYRYRMLADLRRKNCLVGVHYTQVTNLLGAPESTALFGSSNIEYRLGPSSTDYWWLVLDLDERNVVIRERVAHD